jgi:hypothetical protein
MYGLIQSAKLWYKELTSHLEAHGFKKCQSDECIMIKKTADGKHILLLLFIDDILVMSSDQSDRYWKWQLLESKCGKVTSIKMNRLPYLGMTIVKKPNGYELSMRSYIEDMIKLYGKKIHVGRHFYQSIRR